MFTRSVRSRSLSFTRSVLSLLVVLALISAAVLSGCSSASSADDSSQSSSSAAIQVEGPTIDATLIVKDSADVEGVSYPVTVAQAEATVLAAVEASELDAVIEDGPYGKYITSIGGKAAEGSSGWVYTVNGEQVMEAIDVCTLEDGDTVELEYLSM